MASFRTQYDDHPRLYHEPGSRTKTLYGPSYDENGVLSLKVTGKHDLYSEIQSHADSVDIHVLLQRYQNGDPGALARIQGAYGDFTQMPSTFAEALNTMIAAEQYFMGLPVETRAEFGHSFQQFIASMDAPDFSKRMGISPDVPSTPSVSPSEPVQSSAQVSTPPSSDPAPAAS